MDGTEKPDKDPWAESNKIPNVVTIVDVIKVLREEIGHVNQRIYALEIKLSRYDRVFEMMFKEEVDRRINHKQDNSTQCAMEDPFWRLERTIAEQSGGFSG